MLVRKIDIANTDTNIKLQQKQQSTNVAFTGSPKLNITDSFIKGASKNGENGHDNNLLSKIFNSLKNLFKKENGKLTGVETPKPLELGVPHKVEWTDFASIEGELTDFGSKVIKNKDGKVVKKFYSYGGKTVMGVSDYDPKTGKEVKCTTFYKNGKTVSDVHNYDPKTGKEVKYTKFYKDGKTVSKVFDYDPITGNIIKYTEFYEDGKTVRRVSDFDPKTGNRVKETEFHTDGKTVSQVIDYDPKTENRIKLTEFYKDGTKKKVEKYQ